MGTDCFTCEQSFLGQFRPDISASTTFSLQTLDGGSNPQNGNAGLEANLDIQYTVGLATGVPTTFISVGDQFQDGDLEGFLDTINFLLAEDAPPNVLTTSYGQNENTISQKLAQYVPLILLNRALAYFPPLQEPLQRARPARRSRCLRPLRLR